MLRSTRKNAGFCHGKLRLFFGLTVEALAGEAEAAHLALITGQWLSSFRHAKSILPDEENGPRVTFILVQQPGGNTACGADLIQAIARDAGFTTLRMAEVRDYPDAPVTRCFGHYKGHEAEIGDNLYMDTGQEYAAFISLKNCAGRKLARCNAEIALRLAKHGYGASIWPCPRQNHDMPEQP